MTTRVLFVALLVLVGTRAEALPVTLRATGIIDTQFMSIAGAPDLATLFATGEEMTLDLTYDTDHLKQIDTPSSARYRFDGSEVPTLFSWTATVGGFTYGPSGGGPTFMGVRTGAVDGNGGILMDTLTSGRAVSGDVAGGFWAPVAFDFSVIFVNQLLATADLPTRLPDGLIDGTFQLYLDPELPAPGPRGTIEGHLTSIQSIPEPSTLLLTVVAAIVVASRRSRA